MTKNTNHYLSWVDVDNDLHCQQIEVTNDKIIIGRSQQADIEVLNTSVSRLHLELSWHQEKPQIKDLNSSYGTWVENNRLHAGEIRSLEADTEIKLGNLNMWYEMRRENESQEMFQTCFHPTNANDEIELSNEINDFRVKLLFLLQENFGDNTLNVKLIKQIDDELHQLILTQEMRLKEQRILNSISHILNRSLTLSELLKTSLNLVSKVLNADRGFVVIKNAQTELFEITALRHFDSIEWSNDSPKRFSQSLIERCFEQNKILFIGDSELNTTLKDLKCVEQGGGRSVVVIPLVQGTEVVGVIYLDNQQKAHTFNHDQVPFLTTFAAHTSIALHNAVLYKRAVTDDLTQLYTRQFIDEELEREIQNAKHQQHDLSLLILDLDHFKKINDTYGHTTGDEVLINFSSIIKSHLREGDFAGRFGGEEFIVILPHTDISSAQKYAETIRVATESFQINKNHQPISITVSIGVACYQSQHGDNALLLLEDADKALYQAKKQGRNQTICFCDG